MLQASRPCGGFDAFFVLGDIMQQAISPIKVLDTTDDELIVEVPIVLYGGKDLVGDHFDENTDLESPYTKANAIVVDWEHGLEPDKDAKGHIAIQPGRDDILGTIDWMTSRTDEMGRWARAALSRQYNYVRDFIEPLAKVGLIAGSSEAVQKGIVRKQDGYLPKWPIKRYALTLTPCEGRMLTEQQVRVIKSLQANYPALKSLLPIDAQESIEATGEKSTNNNNGDTTMDENTIKTLVEDAVKSALPDIGEVAKQAATESIKAYQAAMDETPAPRKGVTVIADEDEKAAKNHPNKFGLMLQAIKTITTNGQLSNTQKAILGQNESVPEDGGFLVGTEQDNMLEKKMFEVAVFARRASNRTISAGANSVDFYGVKENSRATGSRYGGIRGYRVAEGGTITASSMDFWKYNLKPSKYAVLAYATDEVLADARLLEQEVMGAAPDELAFMIDDDMLNGSSAGYPEGVLNANSLVTVAKEVGQAATTVVSENIIKMWARRWARGSYAWFINQDVTPQLHQLNLPVGTGGALVYMPPGGLSGSPYGTLYGAPVIETEFNATLGTVGDIVLADWSQYKLANMGSVKAASSMHVQFVTDQMAFRFTVRYDGQSSWQSALTPYKGTNTQSPFIALATRS